MPRLRFRFPILPLLFLVCWALPALAHDYRAGSLQIDHPSSVATPPGSANGVAYLSIRNLGEQTDRWLGARTPRADRVELHRSVEEDGMRSMVHIEFPVTLEPRTELKLQPGGYHLMLMGLPDPLRAGERIPLILTFAEAGEVEVVLHVEELGEDPGSHH